MKRTQLWAALATLIAFATATAATPAEALGSATEQALLEALDDERGAQAIYQAVIDRHGEVRPFSNIIEAEKRHESYVLDLLEKYEIEIPPNPWAERDLEVPATFREACVQATEAEKANVEMYDRLLESVSEPEVRDVLSRLQSASEERHLPAFERCSNSNRGQGRGRNRNTA